MLIWRLVVGQVEAKGVGEDGLHGPVIATEGYEVDAWATVCSAAFEMLHVVLRDGRFGVGRVRIGFVVGRHGVVRADGEDDSEVDGGDVDVN